MIGFWIWFIILTALWIGILIVIAIRTRSRPMLKMGLNRVVTWIWLIAALVWVCECKEAFDNANATPTLELFLIVIGLLTFVAFVDAIRFAFILDKVEQERRAREKALPPESPQPLTDAQLTNRWLALISYQMWTQRRRNRW